MGFSNTLMKIAAVISENNNLDEKLLNAKTKQTAIRYIYKKVNHLITGVFHDDNWSNVMKVFDEIQSLGCQLNWQVKNGGYHDVVNPNGEITSKYKQYDLTISFTNVNNKQIKIKGQLIATAAGDREDWLNKQDMFSKYDMALILS